MKAFLVVALLATGLLAARAQSSADDRYIGIYGLIQQADHLAATGETGEAVAAYTDAARQLEQFKKTYPTWSPNIISFRLNQVTDKITELKGQLPPPAATQSSIPKSNATPQTATTTGTNNEHQQELAAQLNELQARLQAQLSANETLQAKLKEALAVQPAATDPRELQKAQEKIRWLMKENDLLKASHGAGQAVTQTLYVTNTVRTFVTNSAVEVTNLAATFEKHPAPAVVTNFVRVVEVDTNAMEMLRLSRAAAVKNFNDEHDRAEQLANELQRLRQAGTTAGADVSTGTNSSMLASLQAQNASLRHELEVLRSAQSATAGSASLVAELNQARARIAVLESEARIAALEKLTLERKLQQLLSATNSATAAVAYEARIRELTQQRDDLKARLDHSGSGGSDAATTAQVASLNSEVATLRSRLAVAEAQPSPYTADELALFKTSAPAPASAAADERSVPTMSADTAELVASAQKHFSRQEFDQAEADYQKILNHDQNNGIALANLAMIELQEGKLAEADKHITAALAKSPNDAYNLTTLGYLRLRQEKYDAAMNALSRAAQLDPDNPEIQNYLGVTLGHLGQRKPAEAAFRHAIQIVPNYAPAHVNLAAIYLNQDPPLAELARWHYQKAVEAGQPRDPALEKLLAEKGAPYAP